MQAQEGLANITQKAASRHATVRRPCEPLHHRDVHNQFHFHAIHMSSLKIPAQKLQMLALSLPFVNFSKVR